VYPGKFARTKADQPCFIMADSGEIVTYGEYEARTNRLAHLLRFLNRAATALAVLANDSPLLARAVAEPDRTKAAEHLFLAILNRLPTANETKSMQAAQVPAKERRDYWRDVIWALVNSSEFVLQH